MEVGLICSPGFKNCGSFRLHSHARVKPRVGSSNNKPYQRKRHCDIMFGKHHHHLIGSAVLAAVRGQDRSVGKKTDLQSIDQRLAPH